MGLSRDIHIFEGVFEKLFIPMKLLKYFILLILVHVIMNAQQNDSLLISLFEKHSFSFDTTLLNYRLFKPEIIEQSKKYPLVLTLHGAGERGNDNELQITWHSLATTWVDSTVQKKYPCFVLSPQCPENNKWVDIDWGSTIVHQDSIPISNELNAVVQLIDSLLQSYPIDENRIYVTGLSMGGFGTWDLITRFPDKFAAAIPMSSAGDPTKANLIKHIPIWAFHGNLDTTVPVEGTCNMVKALRDIGSNIIYTEVIGGTHGIWKPIYDDPLIIDWLFAQKKH